MSIESGICPVCKKEIAVKTSNLDSEDVWGEEDAYVLADHAGENDQPCPGSSKHTQCLLDKDYGDDDLTLADILEEEFEARENPVVDWLDH